MRELVYFVATSLDGRISGPAHDHSAFPAGGDHFDAIVREHSYSLPTVALEALGVEPDTTVCDTVVMGWNTYETGLLQGIREPYQHLRQCVFSRTHTAADVGDDVELVADDPVATVRSLKAEPSDPMIWLCGGGRLAASLVDEIDRLVLKVNPIILGDGPPVVAGSYDPHTFVLTATTPYRSGVVINEYRRA